MRYSIPVTDAVLKWRRARDALFANPLQSMSHQMSDGIRSLPRYRHGGLHTRKDVVDHET